MGLKIIIRHQTLFITKNNFLHSSNIKFFYPNPETSSCKICEKKSTPISEALGICVDCIRKGLGEEVKEVHHKIRSEFLLPPEPPKEPAGVPCDQCQNECMIPEEGMGYCGVNKNSEVPWSGL